MSIQIPWSRKGNCIKHCQVKCCDCYLFNACNKRKKCCGRKIAIYLCHHTYMKSGEADIAIYLCYRTYTKSGGADIAIYFRQQTYTRSGGADIVIYFVMFQAGITIYYRRPELTGLEFLVILSMNYFTRIIILATYQFCLVLIYLRIHIQVTLLRLTPIILFVKKLDVSDLESV